MQRYRPIRILLVDDSPDDVQLTSLALQRNEVASEVTVAWDGEEAINILQAAGSPDGPLQSLPDLVLLDLNLPRMNGIEVIQTIRKTEAFCDLPVIVLSTSSYEVDIARSYKAGVNTYVQKPLSFSAFQADLKILLDYWVGLAKLPPRG